jgi:hypothetical protein
MPHDHPIDRPLANRLRLDRFWDLARRIFVRPI